MSGGDLVFVCESAGDLFSADPVLGEVDFRWPAVGLSRCELAEGTVRPGGVVMRQVLGQHLAQVVLVDDQQPAGDLAAQGADDSLAGGVRCGCLRRAGENPDAFRDWWISTFPGLLVTLFVIAMASSATSCATRWSRPVADQPDVRNRGRSLLSVSCGARLLDLTWLVGAWLVQSCGLGSSLSDLLGRLPARMPSARRPDGAGPARGGGGIHEEAASHLQRLGAQDAGEARYR
jgi:hypothetical protein